MDINLHVNYTSTMALLLAHYRGKSIYPVKRKLFSHYRFIYSSCDAFTIRKIIKSLYGL